MSGVSEPGDAAGEEEATTTSSRPKNGSENACSAVARSGPITRIAAPKTAP